MNIRLHSANQKTSQLGDRSYASPNAKLLQQQEIPEDLQTQRLDLQTQIERAQRYGHNFSQVSVSSSAETPAMQRTLALGASGDKSEWEEDRRELSLPKLSVTKSAQQKPIDKGEETSPEQEDLLQRVRANGQPLVQNFRSPMERAKGEDFDGEREYAEPQPDPLARSIQAKAFITGQDAFFRQGAYEPGSRGGQELIAPELTDVVQQSGGAVMRMKFPNRMPNQFPQENREANEEAEGRGYEQGMGPYAQGTAGFNRLINDGKVFKWILGEKNGLVVISPTLKHSVAAGGNEVISAGHGGLLAEGRIWIDNDTGHYHTTVESLKLSLSEWNKVGYDVEMRERMDLAAAFNNLGGGNNNRCNVM